MTIIKTYNKLVRDRIPEIIESNGDSCKTKILNNTEYIAALNAKLSEEVAEYHESQSIEELADVLEVMMAIVKAHGYTWQDVLSTQLQKRVNRGGFDKKIMLISTEMQNLS